MKILVRGANWIGDAVMSIPALRELRRVFPDSHITLHTRSWADGLFGDVDFIDELVTFDKHRWPIKDVYDNSQFLKDDKFDLAILLPNSFESALTSFLTRVPRRIGYNKDVRGLLLTDPVAVPEWKGRLHEVFYYLHLIAEVERRVLGRSAVSAAMPQVGLEMTDERKAVGRSMLRAHGVDLTKKTVALVAGSANEPQKRWPAERFATLNDKLQNELGANVVLIGSKDEAVVAAKVITRSDKPPLDLTGETTLGEAVAILSIVDLVITNDTGLAHVAPAVGTPTVVIFGPTNPETTRPYSPQAHVLHKKPLNGKNVEWPAVDEVFAAAAIRLQEDVDDEATSDIP
jgi:heptosyltransferase II